MGTENIEQENVETVGADGLPLAKGAVGEEVLDPHIRDDHGDPHQAALADADSSDKVSASTWAAVFFLGLTFQSSIAFSLYTVVPVGVTIANQLQGSTNNVNWVAAGWSLAGSVAFAIAGQLSDYFGRKQILLGGQIVLLIGHTVGASAQSLGQVIAAMVLLGAGTGSTFVLYAGISELLPNKWRSIGLATTEMNLLLFSTFGPITGRALTQNATWRWIFVLGAISGVIAMTGTIIFYHPPRRVFLDRTKLQIMKELDYVGIFLYSSGVTLFLLALGWAGTAFSWQSAGVIVPLVLGVVLFGCTFPWSFYGPAARPVFPLRLVKMFRAYTSLLIIMFVCGLAHISLGAIVPQEINYVFTSNPITAGWYNVPCGFGGAIGGVILGGLVHKMKHVHIQMLVANAVQTLFCGLLAITNPDRVAMGLVFQCLANVPFGWILVISYVTAGLHVPQRDMGLAYGLIGASRFLGGAVGTTIFNTILRNQAASTIPERVADAVIPLGVARDEVQALVAAISSRVPSVLAEIPSDIRAAATLAVRWGYSDAFSYVWYASIPFGVLSCVVSIFVLDPSPYFTNHTAVVSEKEVLGKRKDKTAGLPEKTLEA